MKNWQTKLLKQLYTPLSNLSYARECLTETPQRLAYIHYGDIHTNKIAEVVSAETAMSFLLDFISISSEEKYLLKEGDIVLVDASEDYEGVGKSIEISAIQNKKIVAGLHTIALRPIDATNLAPGFGRYLLKHPLVSKRLKAIAQGTKVFSISFTLIQKLKVLLPPIEEQRKIVEVLETWDKAIQLTRKLIEQKELQKKYLMQQLLTGRTRLKGFTAYWINTCLGTISNIYQPQTISTGDLTEKGYPVFGANGQIGFYNQFNHQTWQIMITCRGATCGTVNRTFGKAWITGNAMVINVDGHPEIDKLFLFYWLLSQNFCSIVSGSGQPQIVRSPLIKYHLHIPQNIEEQRAIASVLAFCDKEIYLLKQKLAKLEEQKKGLMQVLLTGKIRLAVKENK